MPRQDFRCLDCGHSAPDHFYAPPLYDTNHNRLTEWPPCPSCEADLGVRVPMAPFPSRMEHDVFKSGPVSVDLDGRVETFSSPHEMRRYSEESLRKYADGVGSPSVFRALEQDHGTGNYLKNVFTDTPYEKHRAAPPPKRRTRSNQPIQVRAITTPT